MYSHEEIIDGLIVCQIVFIFCYLISTFVTLWTSYGGFSSVVSGLVYAAFCALTYYGLRRNISRTLYGIILGGSFILVFITLESAIYWGQYGNCEHVSTTSQIHCAKQSAMKSICTFSVFLFLSYLVLLGVMTKFKNEILGTAALNEGMGYAPVSTTLGFEKDGHDAQVQ
jgi:hypothetical protein